MPFLLAFIAFFCIGMPAWADEKFVAIAVSGKVENFTFQNTERLSNFYKTYQGAPLWVENDKANESSKHVIGLFEKSWMHGFNPENYRTSFLKQLSEQEVLIDPASFEVLMSDSVARYARDLTGMRLPPIKIDADTTSWSRGVKADEFLTYLATQSNKISALEALVPQGDLYPALQKELVRLHDKIMKDPNGDPPDIILSRLLREGQSDPVIPVIRARLNIDLVKDQDPNIYDKKLADEIAVFQEDNGLKPDRVIGKRTAAAFNEGMHERLSRVIANMERLRWMDSHAIPSRYINVNIPAMRLWAIEDNRVVAEMPVIIGRETRPTLSFITSAVGVRFNPKWHVPDTIKSEDFLPMLQKDPHALEKKNITVIQYTSDGAEPIDTKKVDWSTVTPDQIRNLGMVQGYGSDNALGRIRILMPNRYDIYLHDTNTPDLFSKDFRALSSGCIRMSAPDKIANFILAKNPDWNDVRFQTLLDRKGTSEVTAVEPVKVYILYQTLWLGEGGKIKSAPDLYLEDKKLIDALNVANKLPPQLFVTPDKVNKTKLSSN